MEPLPLSNPTEFKAQIWGYPNTNYLVELTPEGIYYRSNYHTGRAKETIPHPSSESWSKLIQKLNEARLFNWAATYEDTDPKFNGYFWSIKLTVGDRIISSGGHNYFPSVEGIDKPFQMVCQGVSELIGRPFQ